MMKLLMFLIMMMFVMGNMIFVSKNKHLLIVLLSLEFMVLSVYFFMLIILNYNDFNMYMLMVFLVFTVCEGVLGVSILVSMIRTYGNDYIQSYSLL